MPLFSVRAADSGKTKSAVVLFLSPLEFNCLARSHDLCEEASSQQTVALRARGSDCVHSGRG